VRREGRHLSARDTAGDEQYRLTQQQDGRWLWCDKYGNRGGDSIDLVRELDGKTGYAEAIYRLAGAPAVRREPQQRPAVERQPPQIPEQHQADIRRGRAYLAERGISAETIEHAEQSGMLRYSDQAVLFVGRDRSGAVQSATRRAIAADDPAPKRDLRGSDKSHPAILPGDPARVWLVEGGTDALALRDIARREGKPPPTCIVSGGAQIRSLLERPEVQAILRRAEQVTVAGENEKSPEAQGRADEGHRRQGQRIAEITGREVRHWTPAPERGKDLADVNARQVQREQEQEQERIREAYQERSRGMGMGR